MKLGFINIFCSLGFCNCEWVLLVVVKTEWPRQDMRESAQQERCPERGTQRWGQNKRDEPRKAISGIVGFADPIGCFLKFF